MTENIEPKSGEILFYTTDNGKINLGVLFSGETIWLTQAQMVELFQRDKSVISRHIKNVFDKIIASILGLKRCDDILSTHID